MFTIHNLLHNLRESPQTYHYFAQQLIYLPPPLRPNSLAPWVMPCHGKLAECTAKASELSKLHWKPRSNGLLLARNDASTYIAIPTKAYQLHNIVHMIQRVSCFIIASDLAEYLVLYDVWNQADVLFLSWVINEQRLYFWCLNDWSYITYLMIPNEIAENRVKMLWITTEIWWSQILLSQIIWVSTVVYCSVHDFRSLKLYFDDKRSAVFRPRSIGLEWIHMWILKFCNCSLVHAAPVLSNELQKDLSQFADPHISPVNFTSPRACSLLC